MSDDDYEIISHAEIEKLKQEIKDLRDGKSSSPNSITTRIDELLDIFKTASQSMKDDSFASRFNELDEKLDRILDQNQKIAAGVVALADLINENIEQPTAPQPKPQPTPKPQVSAQPNQAPQQNQFQQPTFERNSPFLDPLNDVPLPRPQTSFSPGPQPMSMIPPAQRQSSLPPLPDKMGMPSFDLNNIPAPPNFSGLPPLPPEPPKRKGLFR